jgi:choline dehydrogenase-like flavoprotein
MGTDPAGVVVVGAGVIGCAVARRLARDRRSVVLIEREQHDRAAPLLREALALAGAAWTSGPPDHGPSSAPPRGRESPGFHSPHTIRPARRAAVRARGVPAGRSGAIASKPMARPAQGAMRFHLLG